MSPKMFKDFMIGPSTSTDKSKTKTTSIASIFKLPNLHQGTKTNPKLIKKAFGEVMMRKIEHARLNPIREIPISTFLTEASTTFQRSPSISLTRTWTNKTRKTVF